MFRAVGVGGGQRVGDVSEQAGFRERENDGLGDVFGLGAEPVRAARVGCGQRPGDLGQRAGFPAFVGDGLSHAFCANRVGGGQRPGDLGQRAGFRVSVGNRISSKYRAGQRTNNMRWVFPVNFKTGEYPLDQFQEAFCIVLISAMTQLQGIESRKFMQFGWQFLLPKRPAAIDQHRDHPKPEL